MCRSYWTCWAGTGTCASLTLQVGARSGIQCAGTLVPALNSHHRWMHTLSLSVPCIMHHIPCTMYHAPYNKHHAPCIMRHAPCTRHNTPYSWPRVSRAIHTRSHLNPQHTQLCTVPCCVVLQHVLCGSPAALLRPLRAEPVDAGAPFPGHTLQGRCVCGALGCARQQLVQHHTRHVHHHTQGACDSFKQ